MTNPQPLSAKPMGGPEDESLEGNMLTDVDFSIIVEDCYASLELPATRPENKFILCPVGMVGAGKSTVIRPIAKQMGLVRVSGDEIRQLLQARGFNWVRTQEIAFRILMRLASEGYSIAIDSDCAGPNVGPAIEQQAAKLNYKVVYIHINPPEDFILNKLKNFKHTWLFKDADDALQNYSRRKPLHEHLPMDFVYTFDTSRPDIDDQIKAAIEKITQAVSTK